METGHDSHQPPHLALPPPSHNRPPHLELVLYQKYRQSPGVSDNIYEHIILFITDI